MASKIALPGLLIASVFAMPQLAVAQGTSGSTGAIASIPSSVVRAGRDHTQIDNPTWFSVTLNTEKVASPRSVRGKQKSPTR